jgi:hypothetical protein
VRFVFHAAAEAEHLEAIAYYESVRPGLGASYLVDFERVMDVICRDPERFPLAEDPDIRRTKLRRFPFSILYRQVRDAVQVLAVAHQRRRPGYWLGRV